MEWNFVEIYSCGSEISMRLKINGYILLFTRADHEGRHIHVFKENRELGVFDRIDGPIRGLDAHFGNTCAKHWSNL
jgi:hypothetical protein